MQPITKVYNSQVMNDFPSYARELFGINLTESQQLAFKIYEHELIAWNAHHNLTAITDPQQIRIKHFLDSLSCVLAMQNTPVNRITDVGSGAGFPGLPLKIIFPNSKVTLIESVGKKAAFCHHICQELNLTGVEILNQRAESAAHQIENREVNDWAVARAVASLPILVEYLLPMVRLGGFALAMKGENGPAEVQAAQKAIDLLGGRVKQLIPVILPGVEEERYLIVIEKIAATPEGYPRRAGIPSKRPLGKS